MKPKLQLILCGLMLTLATISCSSPMRFSQYSGSRKAWPVSNESMAETSFALPVYRGWPDKPFQVIGSLRFENPNQNWDDGVYKEAVAEARLRGGEAIIIRQGSEFGVSGLAGSSEDPMIMSQNQTTALVIKWKSQSVIEREKATLRAFKENFRQKYPEISKNSALLDLAIELNIQFKGIGIDSEVASDTLKEILEDIYSSKTGELDGKWLYRCNYRANHLTTSDSNFFYGMALITLRDNVLTIIATQGPEINFSGSYDKGRATGKTGIFRISIDCDGVASKEKISLSGQGLTGDGTFQASLVFVR